MSSTFYQPESNVYRYWASKHRVMLQIKARDLVAFRESEVGKQVESRVDICQVGGGWYEITTRSGSFSHLPADIAEVFESKSGHKIWLAAFNHSHVGSVNANVEYQFSASIAQAEARRLSEEAREHATVSALETLAAKWGKVRRSMQLQGA